MIKAVIFDMDGVIIDSEPVYMARQEAYLTARGKSFHRSELNRLVGASNRESWEVLHSLYGQDISMEELKEDYRRFQSGQPPVDYGQILNPDFRGTSDRLRELGLRIALASSSPLEHIHMVLRECGIEGRFEQVVSGQQFTKSKPDPEIYRYSLARLGIRPWEAVAVEDSAYGIQAAKAAGLVCVALRETRFDFKQDKADYLIERLSELLDYV
jgi:HAD superfamily hydrolase (TIGR01509 family)